MLVSAAASGGGVFDRRWHVVGMVLGNAGGTSRGLALSIDAILEHLAKEGVEFLQGLGVNDLAPPLTPADPLEGDLDSDVTELVIGTTIVGKLPEKTLDPALFDFAVPAHGRVMLSVQNLIETVSPNTWIAGVTVEDMYGNTLMEIATNQLAPARKAPRTTFPFTVQHGRRYRAEVRPVSGTAIVEFSLHAAFDPVKAENHFEPNETAREATRLRVGRRIQTQVGFGYDRVDHWMLTPDRTGVMTIEVRNLSPLNTQFAALADVSVRHAETNVPRPSINGAYIAPGGKPRVSLPFTAEAGTTYVVRIEPQGPRHATEYELKSTLEPYPINDRYEDNDRESEAYDLAPNETIDCLVGVLDDVRDCFVVSADRSGQLVVEITNRNPLSCQFGRLANVLVLDSSGTERARIHADYLQPGAASRQGKLQVEKGRLYYIIVEPFAMSHIVRYSVRTSLK